MSDIFDFDDYVAIFWFLACYVAYSYATDYSSWRMQSLSYQINTKRLEWMRVMAHRDLRMVDTTIMGTLSNGIAFMASTTIFVVGGLFALLGASDKAIETLRLFPFGESTTIEEFELKIGALVLLFVYAFFKFSWAFRLASYTAVLIGAMPEAGRATDNDALEQEIKRAGNLSILVNKHVQRGLRAYFFAIAIIAWFIHAWAFMLASSWVMLVLYRREFASHSAAQMRE